MSSSVTSCRSKEVRAAGTDCFSISASFFSNPGIFPYCNSDALPKSPCLCACSNSMRACSNCVCTTLTAFTAAFSFCHCTVSALDFSFRFASSPSRRRNRSLLAASFSFASDVRSISSCRICRSSWSSSVGLESNSILMREAASSTRSIALSGRNRSVM